MANCMIERGSLSTLSKKQYVPCALPWSKKYRSYIEIIASILDVTREHGHDRYYLMKRTGINYTQLRKYLHSLLKIAFVEASVKERQVFYKTTKKGLVFLEQYYVLLEILLGTDSSETHAYNEITGNTQHTNLGVPNNVRGDGALVLAK